MENDYLNITPPRKITLPDGFRVGIVNLDVILKEVVDLELTDAEAIKAELLARVKDSNYVAREAESEYSAALFEEYRIKIGEAERPLHSEMKESGG